jgi:muramoyltetrapeptide carboxypeptidase LdcA involved in peptidoglycan recycling
MLPDIKGILLEITKEYGFPIIGNAEFGHSGVFMPMPEGILAEIEAEQLSIELVEPVVR